MIDLPTVSTFDVVRLMLMGIIVLAGMVACIAGIKTVRRKVKKEIGLWLTHRKYHPERVKRKLHF